MKSRIGKGDKIKIKINGKFKPYEVVSYDPSEGWITFKSQEEEGKTFTLNTILHQHHIKIPVPTVTKKPKKKKAVKRKPKKTLKQRIKK